MNKSNIPLLPGPIFNLEELLEYDKNDSEDPIFDASHSISENSKFGLFREGCLRFCKIERVSTTSIVRLSRTIRRYEIHKVALTDEAIVTTTPQKDLKENIPYTSLLRVSPVAPRSPMMEPYSAFQVSNQPHLQLWSDLGCFIIKFESDYRKDQWLCSVRWRYFMDKFKRILIRDKASSDDLIYGVKGLVESTLSSPIVSQEVLEDAMDMVSTVVERVLERIWTLSAFSRDETRRMILAAFPLLECRKLTRPVTLMLSEFCVEYPRDGMLMCQIYDIVCRMLKMPVNFGKYPEQRIFFTKFVVAIDQGEGGKEKVEQFIIDLHGGAACPHKRILVNLVACTISSIESVCGEYSKAVSLTNELEKSKSQKKMDLFARILEQIVGFDDWRQKGKLSSILQPVPFSEGPLNNSTMLRSFSNVVHCIAMDTDCEVHQTLLPVREGKSGWIHLLAPEPETPEDLRKVWDGMVLRLVNCCFSSSKLFFRALMSVANSLITNATMGYQGSIKALMLMIEFDVILSGSMHSRVVKALRSTESGFKSYKVACEHQLELLNLNKQGGPKAISLPPKADDEEVKRVLNSGSLGNLRYISLAFTEVTSACAKVLIKLPALRYLNFWGTEFDDKGVHMLGEHLSNIGVLNLCETKVTDASKKALSGMKGLYALNVSSTAMTELACQEIKDCLPNLIYFDCRYTGNLVKLDE